MESPNKKYLDITGKLCDVKFNKNKVRVTEAFIDDIVTNIKENISLPLCADVSGLINDRTIAHMYDEKTRQFNSQIIGSIFEFHKEGFGEESSLTFRARVMKRYGAVCNALTRLFVENRLKFSFEIETGDYIEDEDGSITIDASPLNFLEGVAVVTFPACEDAIARELVAECLTKGDECDLDNENQNAAVEPEVQIAESNQAEQEQQVNANEQTQTASAPEAENASVDTEPTVQNAESNCEDHEDDDKDDQQEINAECEKPNEENAACKEKENASDESSHVPDTAKLIAELKNTVESMAMELASLKDSIASMKTESEKQVAAEEAKQNEPIQVNAEAENNDDASSKWSLLNPFMASMSVGDGKSWTLV